jgi:glycosyltransferase involved in cell wall biosynthesis
MMQSGQAVLDWLDGIDLYLQPSYQEGVPRATIEAMSRGCPIIASKAGGIPELIEQQWLINPGDIDNLANLMIQMLDNPKARINAILKNYEKSKEYSHEFLNSRRFTFWSAFKDFITNSQN